jgi:hypothetical protein
LLIAHQGVDFDVLDLGLEGRERRLRGGILLRLSGAQSGASHERKRTRQEKPSVHKISAFIRKL